MLFLTERELTPLCDARDLAAEARALLDARAGSEPIDRVVVYFETYCAQACEFCELPRLRASGADEAVHRQLVALHRRGGDVVSSGFFDALCDAVAARTPTPALTVIGHDWTRHLHLERIFARLERETVVRVRLEGPSTALAHPRLAARIAALPTLDGVTLTLESIDAAVHDAIVGAPGACARVMAAIGELQSRGVRVHVNCVVTARAVPGLPALLAWLAARRVTVTLLGFLPDRVAEGWDGALLPPVDAVRASLSRASPQSLLAVVQVSGLPLCAVPEALVPRVSAEWQSPVREHRVFAPPCDRCSSRRRCGAVTEGYLAHHGDAGLRPT